MRYGKQKENWDFKEKTEVHSIAWDFEYQSLFMGFESCWCRKSTVVVFYSSWAPSFAFSGPLFGRFCFFTCIYVFPETSSVEFGVYNAKVWIMFSLILITVE